MNESGAAQCAVRSLSTRFSTILHQSIFSGFSNPWLLLFVLNSIVIQMVLGQDVAIVRFSPIYWALVLPALIIPCWSLRQIVSWLLGPGILLLVFLVSAGTFQLAHGDVQATAQPVSYTHLT